MADYRHLANDHDLSRWALDQALSELGFSRPVLWVHPDEANTALEIAVSARFPVLVQVDPSITDLYEWYVTWNGDAVGSPGA